MILLCGFFPCCIVYLRDWCWAFTSRLEWSVDIDKNQTSIYFMDLGSHRNMHMVW